MRDNFEDMHMSKEDKREAIGTIVPIMVVLVSVLFVLTLIAFGDNFFFIVLMSAIAILLLSAAGMAQEEFAKEDE